MKKIFSFLFVLFLFVGCSSNETYIYSKREDSLEKIAKRNFERVQIKYKNEAAYQADIIKWNPDIEVWQEMKKGQIIYIEYPYGEYVGEGAMPDKNVIK